MVGQPTGSEGNSKNPEGGRGPGRLCGVDNRKGAVGKLKGHSVIQKREEEPNNYIIRYKGGYHLERARPGIRGQGWELW